MRIRPVNQEGTKVDEEPSYKSALRWAVEIIVVVAVIVAVASLMSR